MVRFFFIRVMIFCVVMAAIAFVTMGGRPLLSIGIVTGGFLSVYKLRLYKNILTALTMSGKPSYVKSFIIFIFLISLSFIVLLAAIKFDIWLFGGIAAGLVSIMAVICVNAFTEKMGLTHNNWGEK